MKWFCDICGWESTGGSDAVMHRVEHRKKLNEDFPDFPKNNYINWKETVMFFKKKEISVKLWMKLEKRNRRRLNAKSR